MPNGAQRLQLLRQVQAERVAGHDGVDALDLHEVLGGEASARVRHERGAEASSRSARTCSPAAIR